MFATIPAGDQDVLFQFFVGAFFVVAPLVIGLAALAGYITRASRPAT
jgi:hypothetical protein